MGPEPLPKENGIVELLMGEGLLEMTPQLMKSETAVIERAEEILKDLADRGDELAPFRLGQLFFEQVNFFTAVKNPS